MKQSLRMMPWRRIHQRHIKKVIADKETYSARLTALRLHHQLTMLQIAGYKGLAKQLAY